MFGIGMPELLIILIICLILFGASKLPKIGRALGQGIREFKRATKEVKGEGEPEETKEGQEEKES